MRIVSRPNGSPLALPLSAVAASAILLLLLGPDSDMLIIAQQQQQFPAAANPSNNIDASDAALADDDPAALSIENGNANHKQKLEAPPSKSMHPQHTSFFTMDKKAHLAGIRIEPVEPGDGGFIGYTEKSVSIVEPDTPVRVVLFGSFLDEIVLIGFTPNDNCSNTLANIRQSDFTIQTERRIVIIYEFAESKSIYKICLKQKVGDDIYELPFSLVDDLRCSVSTDMPPRKYYFPIWVQITVIAFLLVLSGLFSGLNLGLMSLTVQELTLISNSGSSKERKYAQTILPVRKSGNLLLCSLLIGNVCVNSAISILFDDLTSGYVALVVSSFGIVVFGEIFPQALCVKKGLAVGANTIWITRFFMVLTFPLAYPISRVLDFLLGDEVVSYDRKRLMELIKLSTKNAIGPAEELKIAIGAFEMGDKTVKDVMTKIDDVFMVPHETVLNAKVVAEILRSGYTRVPVYAGSRDNVVSLLFVKDLALLDPDDNFLVKTVCDYYQHPVRRVPENTPLRTMLEEFKKGDYHMALVDKKVADTGDKDGDGELRYELVGLVTLEDIVEEILQAEIVDETDVVTDNVNRTRRRKNQRRDLELFVDESGACQISMQMQLVTIQYLEGNFRAFNPDRIAQSILEKVIRAHVHKVEVSHLADLNDPKTALPRKAKLYTKKTVSDKFILILEGRALVTIGQNEMTFEAGPWQCFGTELLKQLDKLIDDVEHPSQQQKQQQQQNSPGTAADGPTANATTLPKITTTTIRTVTSASGGMGCGGTTEHGRQSQGSVVAAVNAASGLHHPLVDLITPEATKKLVFYPDYSVRVISECTYLEISVQTYLAMYRSTLITRNKEAGGVDTPAATAVHPPSGIPDPVSHSSEAPHPQQSSPPPVTATHHQQQHAQPVVSGDVGVLSRCANSSNSFLEADEEEEREAQMVDNAPVHDDNEGHRQVIARMDGPIPDSSEEPMLVASDNYDGHGTGRRKRKDVRNVRQRTDSADSSSGLLLNGGGARLRRAEGEDADDTEFVVNSNEVAEQHQDKR